MNGVGGRTIAEAKQRLGYDEYLIWAKYRQERGSFNVGRRVEQAVGYLSYITDAMNSPRTSKINIADYMPNEPKKSEEQSLLEAFQQFSRG